ncbi:MAG TPA: hypothetical protein VN969_06420 [Streptosporangiaceae bacterium]|nr:hypothetical protein [Streptosporangiaceae bacterium]
MTAEFPDTSLAELAERQAAAQREAEEMTTSSFPRICRCPRYAAVVTTAVV